MKPQVASSAGIRPPRLTPALAGIGVWIATVAFGFHVALSHAGAPGEAARIAGSWPAEVTIARDRERPTLVLAVHPHCPCTRATLEELDRLVARCRERVSVQVVVYADPGMGKDWERGALWERAASIPGARVTSDPLGQTAALFGARTSGHALLFAPDGKLLFEGGLTIARGHAGDSPGSAAIAELVLSGSSAPPSTPVFGCSLAGIAGSDPRP